MAIRGFFLLLWAGLLPIAGEADFCVQTFNAYGTAYAKDVHLRIPRLVDLVRGEKPACDLIQLQEVWMDGQVEALEEGLSDRRVIPARKLAPKNEKVGLVTISPLTILANQHLSLFEVNNEGGVLDKIRRSLKVEKGFHRVDLTDPSGETIQTVNTHTHPTDQAIRVAQMLQLVEWGWNNLDFSRPIVATGDFNAVPGSLEVRLLTRLLGLSDSYEEFQGGYRAGECTICRENPIGWTTDDRVVDYVFWRNGVRFSLRPLRSEMNWEMAEGEPLSDHKGIRTRFEVLRQPVVPAAAAGGQEAIALLEEAEALLRAENEDYLNGALERVERLKTLFR
ncbi:MAG: endonuclease/exonuclease/phosphatase family protein [Bdellovibrionales bacterium]|nr:endonuclease/exonuclease/phosphatase family protein [Bdellovibrionales bacterium]